MSTEYLQMQRKLCHGWNTWDTRSMLCHVLLPSGLALNLGIKDHMSGGYLKEALIGRTGPGVEVIRPGPHAYDGAYTELVIKWGGAELLVQSAHVGDDLVILATPMSIPRVPPMLIVEAGVLWNREGHVSMESGSLAAYLVGERIAIHATLPSVQEHFVGAQTHYFALPLDQGPVGISTGSARSLAEIEAIVDAKKDAYQASAGTYGDLAEVYTALQSCLAWNTIYDPLKDRAISPVSRLWNVQRGGWVLFCWDTFFAAYLAAIDNRELAYANVVSALQEKTGDGFVPNNSQANLRASRDRSQPPVGSLVARELYRRFGERWFLEEVYGDLLVWNRWWERARADGDWLCWGSNPYDDPWGRPGNNDWLGAAYESGLDNSPMYDRVPFNSETHLMELADVGLMGLYVMDCDCLADIADVLGREADAVELRKRGERFRCALGRLWSAGSGIFTNHTTHPFASSGRVSPTNFYPLLAGAASEEQAERMVRDWFYNPEAFWGEWMMPSIARDDPAYPEQDYWRGRIWGPMNLLVYLGLRRYGQTQARRDLAEKSAQLLLKEWLANGHVHENYNADSGEGCDVTRGSDRFYHWGGLLGLPALIEAGLLDGWERALDADR